MKTALKRTLSLMLTVVMLVSCWAFAMPMSKAQAAGNYDVRVTINVTGTNNIEAAYQGFEGAKGDSAGVTIRCLKDNGVSSSTTDLNWDIGKKGGNQIKTKGNHTLTGTAAGFPAYIYLYICDNYLFSGVGYSVTKLEVKGTSQSSYTTLWSGTMHVASNTNGYGGWLRYDGYVKGFDHGLKNADEGSKGDNENYINTGDKKGWLANFPYRKTGGAVSGSDITLDGTNSKTSAFTVADAKDQYSVNYATTNLNSTAMSTPSYNSSYITYSGDSGSPARTITATKNAHIWDDGINSQNVSVTASWKTRNTTNTMANTTTSKTISITDEKYTYTWNWKETNTSNLDSPSDKSTTSSPYYGDTPGTTTGVSIPADALATKAYYTTAKHWSGGSYGTISSATQARSYTMSYSTNGVGHSYTYSKINNDGTNHKATCSCGYSKNVSHSYGATTFSFANDGKSATVSRTCGTTGCGYVQTGTATVTSTVTTQPTCTAVGTTTYTATSPFGDGATATKAVNDVAALGHDHTSKTTTDTYLKSAATCNDPAVYYYKCSRCADKGSSTYESGSALGHNYTSKTTTSTYLKSSATCTSPAVYYYKCSRCTSKGSDTYTNGNALGHDHTSKTITDTYKKSDATCTSPAVYYYKCSRCADKGSTTYTDGSALGHNNVECSTAPTNGVANSGTVYYHCTRCDKYFGSHYNTSTSSYEAVESTTYETPSAAQTAVAASEPIPAPAFNQFTDASMNNYNYANRGAGLKIAGPQGPYDFKNDPLKDTDDSLLKTVTQGLRFTASMHVPKDVGYTGANRVTDFGYVWSQTDLIGLNTNPQNVEDMQTNLSNLEIGKTNVQKMSVVTNNSGNGTFTGNNWTGVSSHDDTLTTGGKTLTFNLVVNVKAKNWKKAYCARAYITYVYNGRTYTVYDNGYSTRTVEYIANAVVASPYESPRVIAFCQSKVLDSLASLDA